MLVIWGSEDEPCPYRFGERLAARTGGKFVLFEGANHWAPVERPAEFAALLQEFWAAA